jgi:hypothetical protein
MTRRSAALLTAVGLLATVPAGAEVVGGGGPRARDCVVVFDADANSPPPPRPVRNVDCVDGSACDQDGGRNGRCLFIVRLCVNSSALPDCTPAEADAVAVDHAVDDGDPRFDTEFQALQARANLLGFPDNTSLDDCTLPNPVTVRLKPPGTAGGPWGRGTKKLRVTAQGRASGRTTLDKDRMLLTCQPEGSGVYAPRELYGGTFERIAQEVFAARCAVSGCHDSQGHQGNLILLPNAAASQLIGVPPDNAAAAGAGLVRVAPGDPTASFLHRKITDDLPPGWGGDMPRTGAPLTPAQIDLIRRWILGDGLTGPAPLTGWVTGTDQ